MVYGAPDMIGTYVRKIVSCSSSSQLRVARPTWPIYGRPIRPAGSRRLIGLVRMERSACARSSLRKADRLYCSIWPMRWKSPSRMVPRRNEFNDFEIGRPIRAGLDAVVKSSFSVIYVSRGWRLMRRRDVNVFVPKVWEQLLFSRLLANGVRFLELNYLRQSAPIINERYLKRLS